MSRLNLVRLSARPRHFQGDPVALQRTVQESRHAHRLDLVVRADLVVVGLVGEPEWEDALFLEVGLVNTGERAGEDEGTAVVSWLKSCVLTRGTLAVYLSATAQTVIMDLTHWDHPYGELDNDTYSCHRPPTSKVHCAPCTFASSWGSYPRCRPFRQQR